MITKNLPVDKELFETEIGTYWFDDGLLYSLSKNPRRTLENTGSNFKLVKQITGNKKVSHLVYICNSPVPDKATRAFVAKELPTVYTAMALVSSSGLGSIIMGILFKLKPPSIPMKTFSDEEKAKEWLKKYLK